MSGLTSLPSFFTMNLGMSQPTKASKSVSEHIRTLYQRLNELDGRVGRLEARPDGAMGSASSPPVDAEILAQVVELEHRLRQLETENRTLSELCGQLQEQNDAISNLYVAKHRLHASFDAAEVMRIVRDIMVELVGGKEFAIYLLDPRQKMLRRVTGGGTAKQPETVALGDGHLGKAASVGRPFYLEAGGGRQRSPETPLAVIPLRSDSESIGIIAIWQLLPHKKGFTPVDHQLLELVAEHAPAALKSAHLHQKSRARGGKSD
jgi:nitrate/nitrite-specific signal transduction histidine kinase